MDAAEGLSRVAAICDLTPDDVRGLNALAELGDAQAFGDAVNAMEIAKKVPARSTWDDVKTILADVVEFLPLVQALAGLVL